MEQDKIIKFFESIINTHYVDHEDGICGQCEKQRIRYSLAKKYLNKKSFKDNEIHLFIKEVNQVWSKHHLYIKYQELKAQGLNNEQIEEEFTKEGLIL